MPAVDFDGYVGAWLFDDWCDTLVDIKQAPATGHVFATLAENVRCKGNVEQQGLAIDGDAGARPAYTRKFYFAATYRSGSDTLAIGAHLKEGNVLVDGDGNEWGIMSDGEPGDASQHYEVEAARRPHTS